MGGASSKIARKLPTKARSTGGAGKGSEQPPHPVSRSGPVARETRNHDIEIDGKDPQLLSNLNRLGQVNIRSAAGTTSVANEVSEIYRARGIAEQQATSAKPVRNRLGAVSLSSLLDDRKFVTSQSDLAQLAARYTVDISVLESLARFVNTPSIGEGTVVRTVGDDGQEKITMQAVWTEPTVKDRAPARQVHPS